jgi:hypothetical protein
MSYIYKFYETIYKLYRYFKVRIEIYISKQE